VLDVGDGDLDPDLELEGDVGEGVLEIELLFELFELEAEGGDGDRDGGDVGLDKDEELVGITIEFGTVLGRSGVGDGDPGRRWT